MSDVCVDGGAADSQSSGPRGATPGFSIQIDAYFPAEGFREVFQVTEEDLVVLVDNDFGAPRRELCRRSLGRDEANRLGDLLDCVGLESLRPEYVNRGVADGLEVRFEIARGREKRRAFLVANTYQRELDRICEAVVRLVPAGCVDRLPRLFDRSDEDGGR